MNAGPVAEGHQDNAGDNRLSIGRQLADARKRHKLDVETVARTLKLDPVIIRALEVDDRDRLPATIFVQGYLRNYARLVGLPGEELVRSYAAQAEALPPLKVVRIDTRRKGLRLPNARLMRRIVLLLLAVVTVWLAYPFVEKLVVARDGGDEQEAPGGRLELPPVDATPAPEMTGKGE